MHVKHFSRVTGTGWFCSVLLYFNYISILILFYTPVFKTGRIMVYQCPTVCPSVRPFHMSLSNLRTPRPIHFKLRIVIGIVSLMVCILYGEISIFHSRVMGLYSSNCRRFFVCRTVNWELLGQFTSNFAVIGIDSLTVCILFGEISIFHSRVVGLSGADPETLLTGEGGAQLWSNIFNNWWSQL
jgi:hypothetical protein